MSMISLIFFATSALASTVSIRCDGVSHSQQFKNLFSLDILLDEESQIHLGQGKEPEVASAAKINVFAKRGSLLSKKPVLNATLDVDCSLVDKLECELYGLLAQNKNYTSVRFKPRIQFDDTIRKECIKQHKDTYRTNEVSLVTCSANVGTNHTDWTWQIQIEGEQVTRRVDPRDIQVFPSKLTECAYHTVSRLIYINEYPGQVTFKCQIGKTVVGSASAVVILVEVPAKNEEALGTMLFLSAIIFVYPHFCVLPCIFAKWDKIFTYREDVLMLKWRSLVSYILGVVFLICCSVICSVYRDAERMTSYLAFAIMECFFIMTYATLRLLSKCLSSEHIGLLNTARIVASSGAVLVPVISWIIIRIQGGVGIFALEIIFYIVTAASLSTFAHVSFGREGKYRDKKLT